MKASFEANAGRLDVAFMMIVIVASLTVGIDAASSGDASSGFRVSGNIYNHLCVDGASEEPPQDWPQ